jgi:PIN domain nuclease of toxin-antitoxin system
MEVVVDSHTLFWFLTNKQRLSRRVEQLLRKSDYVIVPTIVLMEILYILEKNRISFKFVEVLSELKIRKYIVYPLDLDVISQVLSIDSSLEMHDRIIIATAQIYNAILLSKDRDIKKCYQKTVL